MRTLTLSTSSNETDKYSECLGALGLGENAIIRYDPVSFPDQALYSQVKEWKPDFIVYIGTRWGKQPSISTLVSINNRLAPMVHICSDAADPPWHDLLRDYNNAGAFALQVAIDGSHKWPFASSQMTALTPVDPKYFPPEVISHDLRAIACGYGGNAGSGPGTRRTELLSQLLGHPGALDIRIRSNLPHTYEAYCLYLAKLRMSLNIAFTGTEVAMHVKGRVLESGLAGACLLEPKGSPTSYWFKPGIDYLEYETADDVLAIIKRLENNTEQTQAMGESLRRHVIAEHSPMKFWTRIFDRVGLKLAA